MAPRAALDHSLIRLLYIDSRYFGKDGIGKHGNGVVANHAVVVLSPEIPDGQVAVSLVVEHHVADKLRGNVGRDERVKRMRGAEGVPKAESAVISLSLRHLLDFKVGSHVATVNVAHRVGLHQNVVKTCVEDGFLFVGALNVNAAEFSLPSVVGGLNIFVEVPALGFRQHVFPCAFAIHRRDGNFYHQLPTIGWVETQCRPKCFAIHHIAITDIEATIHQQMLLEWLGKLGTEVHLTQFCPTRDYTIAFYGVVIDDADLALDNVVSATL